MNLIDPEAQVPVHPSAPLILAPEEVRVLGVLIEKALSTPEYYPLSLNAVVMACNQKNNRQPLTAYDESLVVRALDALREKRLVAMVTEAGARVPKYRQLAGEQIGLDDKDLAVMAELLVRGPQTVGELKNRGERMSPLGDLAAVQTLLDALAQRSPALVARMARQPGLKECRYGHLLGGPLAGVAEGEPVPLQEPVRAVVRAEQERLAALENEVAVLRGELQALQADMAAFRKQFE
jgi:uncharacterized protein YceH (UPF0502 family)